MAQCMRKLICDSPLKLHVVSRTDAQQTKRTEQLDLNQDILNQKVYFLIRSSL